MAQHEKPATRAGLPVVLMLGGVEAEHSKGTGRAQGPSHCPLLNPRTRSEALHTACEFNAAAMRCRTAAPQHPGSTGLTLTRLAGHYAGMARDWFARADAFPSVGVMQ